MKITHKIALGLTALLWAAVSHAQTNASAVYPSNPSLSLRDNPGVLGHSYADLNYSWVDFDETGIDANGFIAGLSGNVPIARGLDVGLGYNYYRENNHRNPFNNSSFDVRYHQLATSATFYTPTSFNGAKPFLGGMVGYQWARGDLQSFRTYDDDWTWGATAGVEIPLGTFALTPRVSYSDTMRGGSLGSWHYGAEAHHWFSEKLGGYLDATFHDPRGAAPEAWTYTAGLRFRF